MDNKDVLGKDSVSSNESFFCKLCLLKPQSTEKHLTKSSL